MLVNRNSYGFSNNKKYIEGQGFVDFMSSAFRSVVPALKSVGTSMTSYLDKNKDLIAKPVLGAIGALAATGLTAGVPAMISHIVNRNRGKNRPPSGPLVLPDSANTPNTIVPQDSALFRSLESSQAQSIPDNPEQGKYKEILNSLINANVRPVTSIIGSGLKKF
jgi:hypothetical protein